MFTYLTVIIVFRLLYCKFNDSDALFKNSTNNILTITLSLLSTVAVLGAGLMGAGIAQVSKESFYEFKSKLRLKGLLQSLALVSMWWAFLINFFVSIKCGLLKILGENISVNILMGWGPYLLHMYLAKITLQWLCCVLMGKYLNTNLPNGCSTFYFLSLKKKERV